MHDIVCKTCKKEFSVRHNSNRKYCSTSCSAIGINNAKRTGEYKSCLNCQKSIYVASWDYRKSCCSVKCAGEWKTKCATIKVSCENEFCKNEFITNKKKPTRFCGIKCLNIYRSQLAKIKHKIKDTKPELEFKALLEKNKIQYIFQKALPWKRGWKKWYDFYIPEYNLLIEVDGKYWHGKDKTYNELNDQQKQTRDNDNLKNDLAKNLGFNLARVWCESINNRTLKKIIKKYE